MMSAKQKRFHSSPPGPHQRPPSVSTPSTSMATARIVSSPTAAEFSRAMRLDRGAHAAKFFNDRTLPLIGPLYSVPFCLLPQPDIAYQPRDAVGLEGGRMIRTPHRAIRRDVALNEAGSQCSSANAGRNPSFMSGVADGHAISCGHSRDRTQIQLAIDRWGRTGSVHQDRGFFPYNFDCVVDLGVGAHASRENNGLSRGTDVPQQPIVRQRCGSDFVNRNVKTLQEIHGALVPGGREPEHLDRFAEGVDLFVLFLLEFEAVLEVSIRRAKGILSGLAQLFRRVHDIDGPFLEFNRVAAGSQGYADKSLSKINITVMVNTDFRNDEARLAVSD